MFPSTGPALSRSPPVRGRLQVGQLFMLVDKSVEVADVDQEWTSGPDLHVTQVAVVNGSAERPNARGRVGRGLLESKQPRRCILVSRHEVPRRNDVLGPFLSAFVQPGFCTRFGTMIPSRKPSETHSGVKLLLPPWAERIQVRRSGEKLWVRGKGLYYYAVSAEAEQGPGRGNLLADFFRSRRAMTREQTPQLPHLNFAAASTDDELIEFVKRYGPVWASVPEDRKNPRADSTLVCQSLPALRAEQRIFRALVELVGAMREGRDLIQEACAIEAELVPGESDADLSSTRSLRTSQRLVRENAEVLAKIRQRATAFAQIIVAEGPPVHEDAPWSVRSSSHLDPLLLQEGNDTVFWGVVLEQLGQVLCEIFNAVETRLYATGPFVQELPTLGPRGVRPLLYYLLRAEYLHGQMLRACQRADCGAMFIPTRRHAKYCSPNCETVERQKRYENKRRKRSRS
jgi:hypothetical protein